MQMTALLLDLFNNPFSLPFQSIYTPPRGILFYRRNKLWEFRGSREKCREPIAAAPSYIYTAKPIDKQNAAAAASLGLQSNAGSAAYFNDFTQ